MSTPYIESVQSKSIPCWSCVGPEDLKEQMRKLEGPLQEDRRAVQRETEKLKALTTGGSALGHSF